MAWVLLLIYAMIPFILSVIFTTVFVFEAGAVFQCEDLFKNEATNQGVWDLSLPVSASPVLHVVRVPRRYLMEAMSGFPELDRLDSKSILKYFNRKKENTSDGERLLLQDQLQSRAQALRDAEIWAAANGWDPLRSRSVEILSEDFVRSVNDSWFVQKDHSVQSSFIAQNPFFAYRQGWFNVVVHGSGSTFIVNQRIVTAEVLAQEIKKRNHRSEPVNLLSCRAGTCSLAQDLANALNVPVVGSSQTIETTYDSFQLILGLEPNYHQLHGQWDVYLPEGQ